MNDMLINKCDQNEIIQKFQDKYTKKEIIFHIDVLHQIWTSEQEQLLIKCVKSLGNTQQPDFNQIHQQIGEQLNKTKTQIKKHWNKIKNQLITEEQIQQFIIKNYWEILKQKQIDYDLNIKSELIQQMSKDLDVPIESIEIQYKKYQKRIIDFDKFYYSKDKKIIKSWIECNKDTHQSIQNLLELLSNDYDVLEIYRFQLKNSQD